MVITPAGCRQSDGSFSRTRSPLGPVRAVQGSVLNGFAQVLGLDRARPVEIGYRPRYLEDAVVGARGETEPLDRRFEQFFPVRRNRAVGADQFWRHLGVRIELLLALVALELNLARAKDAFAHARGAFDLSIAAQFLVFHGRDFYMYVNAVEQRPGDFGNVALNLRRRAVALAGRVAEKAARARVHGRGQHESRRKADGSRGARDGHAPILERLAHHFQNVALELGQFI